MLDEKLIERASDITLTDYSDCENDYKKANCVIEELISHYEYLQEELKDYKQNVADNYIQKKYEDMI